MGIGPITAIPKALKLAGLSLNDIELIELNEALAAQVLAIIRTLNLDQAQSTSTAKPSRSAIRWAAPEQN